MLGKRIAHLRAEKNLSQVQLAKALEIAPSTLALYEVEKRQPNFDMLNKIADFFGVSTDYLLGRTDYLYPPKDMGDINVKYIEVVTDMQKEGMSPEELKEMWESVKKIALNFKTKAKEQ